MSDQHEDPEQGMGRAIEEARAFLAELGGIPAIEDELIGDSLIKPGPKRFLNVEMVWMADEEREPHELGCGLRFAVSDADHNHLYSFALDHQLLLAAVALSYRDVGPSLEGLRCDLMEEGQKVWAPDPDGEEVKAVFFSVAVDEPLDVDGISRDAAWICWEEGEDEGTTARVPYFKLRPREEE